MFECPLSGEYHGGPGSCFIAGLYYLEVAQRASRLHYGRDPFFDGHIHPVSEGEKGVGYHAGPRESALGDLGPPVYLLQDCPVFPA